MMVISQFYQILTQLGVEPIRDEGSPFDPEIHEAVGEEEREDFPPKTVVRSLQKGFKIHERLLRPSRVIVSKPPALTQKKEENPSQEEEPSEKEEKGNSPPPGTTGN
jgi:molecular chaperone GrpE